jgi:hypothetical protein
MREIGSNPDDRIPLVVAASDNQTMARLAKPLSAMWDVFPLISKWSLEAEVGNSRSLDSLKSIVGRALKEIFRLADGGNDDATRFLHGILVSKIRDFDELCQRAERHAFFEAIALKTSIWPGLLSCDADINKQNKDLLARLRLGRDTGLNYSGRQWTRGTPEIRVALKLWGILKFHSEAWRNRHAIAKRNREARAKINQRLGRPANFRPVPKPLVVNPTRAAEFKRRDEAARLARGLKPLSRNNYGEWFKAGMPEFINFCGEDFENHRIFAGYWKNAAYRDQNRARALIRRDIKKKLKQAFRSIAPHSSAM